MLPTQITSTASPSIITTSNSPTSSTTTVPDSQTGTGGPTSGSIAGVIVAVLVIIIILTIAVIVVVMCIKRKQKERRVIVSRAGEETGGIPNVVYGGIIILHSLSHNVLSGDIYVLSFEPLSIAMLFPVVLEEKLSINTYTDKSKQDGVGCLCV